MYSIYCTYTRGHLLIEDQDVDIVYWGDLCKLPRFSHRGENCNSTIGASSNYHVLCAAGHSMLSHTVVLSLCGGQ